MSAWKNYGILSWNRILYRQKKNSHSDGLFFLDYIIRFSSLRHMKTRNQLDLQNNMRVKLSTKKPKFDVTQTENSSNNITEFVTQLQSFTKPRA